MQGEDPGIDELLVWACHERTRLRWQAACQVIEAAQQQHISVKRNQPFAEHKAHVRNGELREARLVLAARPRRHEWRWHRVKVHALLAQARKSAIDELARLSGILPTEEAVQRQRGMHVA